jgi:uncharacterized protein HemY
MRPMAVDASPGSLASGEEVLRSREWETARSAFEVALQSREPAEANDGLGLALWWLRDVDAAIAHRERAYAAFRKRGTEMYSAR